MHGVDGFCCENSLFKEPLSFSKRLVQLASSDFWKVPLTVSAHVIKFNVGHPRFMGLKNQLLFFLSNKALVRYSVFNLEIGQSGLYIPHGILNSRVI